MSGSPRTLHPVAWWGWAAGVAVAASRTTNLVLLLLLAIAAGYVVAARRTEAPWASAYRVFLRIALVIVAIRVALQALVVGSGGATVLVVLPQLPLPAWLTGVRVGGPVTAEAVLAALGDGGRLAAVMVCFGAANALASPSRLLRTLPRALHELGVAVVVALSAAPQLVTAVGRVRRARRLRALPHRGVRGALTIIGPVLEEALDRAMTTAAALDARGYGRRAIVPVGRRRATATALLGGLLSVVLGLYGLLDGSTTLHIGPLGAVTTGTLGPVLVLAGAVGCVVGLRMGGRAVVRTRYRPDRFLLPEWLALASGTACAGLFVATAALGGVDSGLAPDPWSLQPPGLPPLAALGVLCALLPAHLTPPPPPAGTPEDT
ncbi:hypothetical protein [Streptoalloteichus hindustanus]|uniref:Energy-coupling factor transport system permease protein n=1 Tax=Streptoalloteichus hindustanus TaxID=2017 RepID=A0A1M5QCU2_STRHI|nr:hypothetical protein [Streptoalloteichus hindustanus]SHH11955.1 energy-coupling factor transport system permease protein [Streptoalloteichus hindustanus]